MGEKNIHKTSNLMFKELGTFFIVPLSMLNEVIIIKLGR